MSSLISESVKSCMALSYSVRIRKFKVKFKKRSGKGRLTVALTERDELGKLVFIDNIEI